MAKATANTPVNEYDNDDNNDAAEDLVSAGAFRVNLASIPDSEAPIEGTFSAVIRKATPGVSKNKNPKIDIQWQIQDDGPYFHRNIFDTLTFTEKAMFRVRDLLLGIGVPKDFDDDITPEFLFGQQADLKIVMQPGNGDINPQTNEPYGPRPVVRKYMPYGSARKQGIESIIGDDE